MDNKYWLNDYAILIDKIRESLTKLEVKKVRSFEYAVTLIFSRMTLTMVEIYTLLHNGYPQGALSLCE